MNHEIIPRILAARQIKQRDICLASGLSPSAVSGLVAGTEPIGPRRKERLLAALEKLGLTKKELAEIRSKK